MVPNRATHHICNLQYVRNNETPFSIRWNNHKKDVKDTNAILGHAKFTIIDRLTNINFDKEILRKCLIQREKLGYKN